MGPTAVIWQLACQWVSGKTLRHRLLIVPMLLITVRLNNEALDCCQVIFVLLSVEEKKDVLLLQSDSTRPAEGSGINLTK